MINFTKPREMFRIPEGMVYLNGDSLGPMPKAAPEKILDFRHNEWATDLIKGWFMQTNTLGDRIAPHVGAPAFIYVAPRLIADVEPALAGWNGHAAPFDFDINYRPMPNKIDRMRIGTPSIASFAILEAALDVWEGVDMRALRKRSIELMTLFINEVEARCPGVTLAGPRDINDRGSHVSFRFEHGYPCMQALIAQKVIGDFRAPDIMRFGITPLFINEDDILRAVGILEDILKNDTWKEAKFQTRSAVT